MYFKFVDQSATRKEITQSLLEIAASNNEELSPSRADKLANKFKRGEFDPDLARILQHTDSTGEIACGFMANPFAPIELQGATA